MKLASTFCLAGLFSFLCGRTIVVHRAVAPAAQSSSAGGDPPSDPATQKNKSASSHNNEEQVESVKGVPFYIKRAGCKHHTSWLQPVYTLTLTTITSDTPSGGGTSAADCDGSGTGAAASSQSPKIGGFTTVTAVRMPPKFIPLRTCRNFVHC